MRTVNRVLAASAIVLVLDAVTKRLAESGLDRLQPRPLLGQWLRLTLGHNTGVAFGLFANGGIGPLLVTGAIIAGLLLWLDYALRTRQLGLAHGWPLGLLLGGAIANFADRVPDGRVTDFLDVGLGAARWPTFNLADSFIVLGIALLFLGSLRDQPRRSEVS